MASLPAYEDWRWPFEKGEMDEDKAARLIHNARKAEETALDKVKSKDAELVQLATDLEAERAAKSGTDEDSQAELKDLRKKARELEAAQAQPDPAAAKEIAQLQVALRLGLSESASKRLVGETLEDIEADAKLYAAELGIEVPGSEDNDDQGAPHARPQGNQYRTGVPGADGAIGVKSPKEFLAELSS